MDYTNHIAKELGIRPAQVEAVVSLLDDGATVPFIARYRKEAHGSLDEVAILAVRDRLEQLKELEARRAAIIASLEERDLLNPELNSQIAAAETMSQLEDLYLPYRPKRRTRAMLAREKGLEPLAMLLLEQNSTTNPETLAAEYVNSECGVATVAEALAGARDIVAEIISEDAEIRGAMRNFFMKKASLSSKMVKGKEEEGAKFRDYFEWQEPAASAAGHRILAMLRGENEGVLSLHFMPEAEAALAILRAKFIKNSSAMAKQIEEAIEDGYKRLLAPSMETELRNNLRQKAEAEAIAVFARNLRQLLLASPLGQKRVLAIDPGFRTGCKVACLDAQGRLLHHDLINILTADQLKAASDKLHKLHKDYKLEAVAIGNGTASRETETLVRSLKLAIPVVVVNESGASVYSASEVARREFPELDLTVRGAISIGRRLMDPLAELVKIDPKAIGVGQYQHDVDQGQLKQSLDDVVVSCVNAVGVELNTASAELLEHVSGLGPALAKSIVSYREANGPFEQRKQLMKVPRLGPKAFEQSAGFLRIHGGKNPLDASAVHPESYPIVEAMAKDLDCTVQDLMVNAELRGKIDLGRYVKESIGLPTLQDITRELEKPGRDPRDAFEAFEFDESINSIEQLEPGMRLPGIVTNVTNFGAFVDIGVHQDGLVHISQMADSFVSDPHTVLKVQQKIQATVLEVDIARKRISLSLRSNPESESSRPERQAAGSSATHRRTRSTKAGDRSSQDTGSHDAGGYNPFKDLAKKLR